jgi:hypothetical protein
MKKSRASADAVLAMNGLLGHSEQRPDLGPAEAGVARSSNGHFFTPGECFPRVCDGCELPDDASIVANPYGCPHGVSIC